MKLLPWMVLLSTLVAPPTRTAFIYRNPEIHGVTKDTTGNRPPSSYAAKVVWAASRPPTFPPGPWKYELDAQDVGVSLDGTQAIRSCTKTKAFFWELGVAANFETVPPAPVYRPEWASALDVASFEQVVSSDQPEEGCPRW